MEGRSSRYVQKSKKEAPFIIYSSNARAWLLDHLPPSMDRRRRHSGIHRVKCIRAGGRHPLWHGHRAGRPRLSLQVPRKRNHSVQGFHWLSKALGFGGQGITFLDERDSALAGSLQYRFRGFLRFSRKGPHKGSLNIQSLRGRSFPTALSKQNRYLQQQPPKSPSSSPLNRCCFFGLLDCKNSPQSHIWISLR
ncbi:hypothetical protein TNCV_3760031 [Trichonephila clavipes]|nr:hypothetical protein TNCV_3760031 [Trichonephila clavipes]